MVLAAAYGVPDPEIGDRVMAAIQLADDVEFDPDAFATFLAAQPDLGPKWVPSYVRVVSQFPMTQTNKILKRDLVKQQWRTGEPIWFRPGRELAYVPFTSTDRDALAARFAAAGTTARLTN